ncbi:MAG: histidine kinase dimerization/phospho-acceptor domain-containing protein [Burkholderiales bacterium]
MHDPTPSPPASTSAAPASAAGSDASLLLRTLAHDLRNPLAGLRNAVQLARTARDPKVAAQALAIVERQTAQLCEVVEDVVDIATLASGVDELALVALDVAALATASVAMTADARARRGQSLAVSSAPHPLAIVGDEARLVRALARVLERAGAGTPAGANVTLAVTSEDGRAVLRVRTGSAPGAASSHALAPSSEAGQDVAQDPSGTALPLAARVVDLHGGTLTTARVPGGMEIAMSLPLARRTPGRRA